MYTGKIKFYNGDKGYGFIINDENGRDVFFHISGLNYPDDVNYLVPDKRVQFEMGRNNRGECAVNITMK